MRFQPLTGIIYGGTRTSTVWIVCRWHIVLVYQGINDIDVLSFCMSLLPAGDQPRKGWLMKSIGQVNKVRINRPMPWALHERRGRTHYSELGLLHIPSIHEEAVYTAGAWGHFNIVVRMLPSPLPILFPSAKRQPFYLFGDSEFILFRQASRKYHAGGLNFEKEIFNVR